MRSTEPLTNTGQPSCVVDTTPAERRVLELYSEGLPLDNIAAYLGLSIKTVNVHLMNVRRANGLSHGPGGSPRQLMLWWLHRTGKLLLGLFLALFTCPPSEAALVTTTISSFNAGACRVEIDYNDATLVIVRARIVNNSTKVCSFFTNHTVLLISRDLTAQPGQTEVLNLPNGISFTTDADGIRLGPITMGARWE